MMIRQGDGLPIVGPHIARVDAAHAAVQATEFLLNNPKPTNGNGWTFEVTSIKSMPKVPERDSWYVPKPNDRASWEKVFSALAHDR
jgi:hypothetical protein